MVRLLPARTRVCADCFWGEQGCGKTVSDKKGLGQAASAEKKGAASYEKVYGQVASGDNKSLEAKVWSCCFRRTRVCSVCF